MMAELQKFGRLDDWLRWAVGGLVAGLVAYASVGARLATLETLVQIDTIRAAEDRAAAKIAIDELTRQVTALTIELRQEEERRALESTARRLDK